jgi:hypothetical protein
MSGVNPTRRQQHGEKATMNESSTQTPPHIRIDVPLGTPYLEIRDSILRQAWQLAGTQLRAAIALGITPETVSRNLRRSDRTRSKRYAGSSATDDQMTGSAVHPTPPSVDQPADGAVPAKGAVETSPIPAGLGIEMGELPAMAGRSQLPGSLHPYAADDGEENVPALPIDDDIDPFDL